MYTNRAIILAVLLIITASINKSFAQSDVKIDSLAKKKKSLVVQIGGGISYYAREINIKPTELPGSTQRSSPAATIRIMWYPQYRLRFGIESGFTNFYSYKIKNGNNLGKVHLSAIPILAVWSMQVVRRVNVYAGFGTYFLTTHLSYKGEVDSKVLVLGSNIALSYTQPISKNAGIAAEAKWTNAFETKDAALSLQVHMVWRFLQW